MTPQQVKDLLGLFNKRYGRLLILVIIGVIIALGALIGHRLQEDRNTSKQVVAWHKKYNYLITNLTNSFEGAQVASKADSITALTVSCTQIQKTANAALHAKKIPDPNIERYWTAALENDVDGSVLCSRGATQGNNDLMEQANSYYNKGATDLQIVATDLKKAAQVK